MFDAMYKCSLEHYSATKRMSAVFDRLSRLWEEPQQKESSLGKILAA